MEQICGITGAILAGGGSRRMKRDKALLDFNGTPFIRQISRELQNVFQNVIIISGHSEKYKFLGLPAYGDIYKNCGPLGGIHSALVHSPNENVFVVPCDMPNIDRPTIRQLLKTGTDSDVIIFSAGEELQPLLGLYRRACIEKIERHLKRGQYSVLKFLDTVRTLTIPGETRKLTNINTPEDYKAAPHKATYHETASHKTAPLPEIG